MRCGVAFHRCGPTNQGQFRAWLLASVWITASAAIPTETSAQTAAEPPASAEPNIQQLPQVVVRAPAAPKRPVQRRTARQANTPASRPPVPSAVPAAAAGPTPPPPETAAERTVTREEIAARPITRPAEVLEAAPGLIITQHSGEGKARHHARRKDRLVRRAALPLSRAAPADRGQCVPLPGDSAAQRAAWVPVRQWLAHPA